MSDDNSKKLKDENGAKLVSLCSFSVEETRKLATGTADDRAKVKISVSDVTKEQVLTKQEMTFLEEFACILLLAFGVPNGIFTIPTVLFLVGKFVVGNIQLTFAVFSVAVLPLAILPQSYIPSILQSWMSIQVIKYFSFRLILESLPPTRKDGDQDYRPQIFVAPPHGVFPYGNILAMLTWPTVCGQGFRGLSASSALRPPIFKQILRSIGVIDASRQVARKALESGESLGISTGGVAEVFETNEDDECIVLK